MAHSHTAWHSYDLKSDGQPLNSLRPLTRLKERWCLLRRNQQRAVAALLLAAMVILGSVHQHILTSQPAKTSNQHTVTTPTQPSVVTAKPSVPSQPARKTTPVAAAAPQQGVLAGKIIALDAGHGGANPGARGPLGSLEKHNVLATVFEIKRVLNAAGAKVVLTRYDDTEPGLHPGADPNNLSKIITRRTQIAANHGAQVLISIHNDWNTNSAINGTTTYYWGSPRLGRTMQNALVAQLGSRNIGAKRNWFTIIKSAQMPAVLVEVGFISNKKEEQRLRSTWYQQQVGIAIRNGLQKYFQGG